MYPQSAILLLLLAGSTTAQCPLNCQCFLESKGRNVVECKKGGMLNSQLFTNISYDIEILKITAPEENMNTLSMSPQIQNYMNLEEIHITRSNIPNLGEHFFYGLEKLEVLNLAQNNITQILPVNFQGLIRLKELYLDDNRIYSMPSESFRYLHDLKSLSIQRNRISEVMIGIFRGLYKLKVLKLNGNPINEFNAAIFKDITDLRVFECRGCSLTHINPSVNELLASLTHLDLGENKIKKISPSDFKALIYLRVLKLDFNSISFIPNLILSNQTELRKLTLARNTISKIEFGAFENLLNLTDLDLGYNKLESLEPEVIEAVSGSLEKLVLSGNRITLCGVKEALEGGNLRELHLENLGLAELESEPFLPQSVAVLSLANNRLSYLPAYALPVGLRELDLSGNMFRGIEADVLDKIDGGRIGLDNNPWSCDLCHIIPMLERVNRSSALYNVRCATPYHHAGKILGTLQRHELSWCSAAGYSSEGANFFSSRDEARLGMIAAGASVLLLILTCVAILAALCYSKRHAAKYYTYEEKRPDERESIFETQSPLFGEELNFKFPLDLPEKKVSIATIDEIKKEHAVQTNGT